MLGYSVFSKVRPLGFLPRCGNMDILDSLDFISNSVLMPLAGIFTAVLVIAVIGLEKISNEIRTGKKWYREYIYQFCMAVFVIPCLLLILLNSIGVFQ